MRAFITGAAGFIGSSMADRLLARRSHGRWLRQLVDRPGAVPRARAHVAELHVRPRRHARRARADRGDGRLRLRVPSRRQRRRAVRHRPSEPGSRAEHDRHVQRARSDARERHQRRSRSRRPARSTAKRPCSRRPRTRRSRSRPRSTARRRLAGEGLIQAYCEGFGFQGWIFRFVSILGERYSHGHVFDFYKQPARGPDQAAGARQRQAAQVVPLRPGLHRRDPARDRARDREGQRAQPRHRRVLRGQRLDRLDLRGARLTPERSYTGGERGWIGDNPFIFLDCKRIRALGWAPKLTIREGVLRTLDYLQANRGCWSRARERRWSGLWHLGSVTAACLAAPGTTSSASTAMPPRSRRCAPARRRSPSRAWTRCSSDHAGRTSSSPPTSPPRRAPTSSWVTYDTPVDADDRADVEFVVGEVAAMLPHLRDGAWCSCRRSCRSARSRALEALRPGRDGSPARPRTCGSARPSRCSRDPDRVIVGVRDDATAGGADRAVRADHRRSSSGCRSSRPR